jgi:hypothetical protein
MKDDIGIRYIKKEIKKQISLMKNSKKNFATLIWIYMYFIQQNRNGTKKRRKENA